MSISNLKNFKKHSQGIEQIITVTPTLTQTVTMSNGSTNTFVMTVTGASQNSVMASFFWTIFIGSEANQNNLPNGNNVTASQWVVTPYVNDWWDSTDYVTIGKVYVENVSAGSGLTVIFKYSAVLIQNSFSTGAVLT
jgi:hypothetical protein